MLFYGRVLYALPAKKEETNKKNAIIVNGQSGDFISGITYQKK